MNKKAYEDKLTELTIAAGRLDEVKLAYFEEGSLEAIMLNAIADILMKQYVKFAEEYELLKSKGLL